MWGCNWILFIRGWFCPLRLFHLIGRKSLHFEKIRTFKGSEHKWRSNNWTTTKSLLDTALKKFSIHSLSANWTFLQTAEVLVKARAEMRNFWFIFVFFRCKESYYFLGLCDALYLKLYCLDFKSHTKKKTTQKELCSCSGIAPTGSASCQT